MVTCVSVPVNPSPHPWISPTYWGKGRVSVFFVISLHCCSMSTMSTHIKLLHVASKKPFFFLGGSPWLCALRLCVNQTKTEHNPVCERVLKAPGGGMAFAPAKSPASSSCSFFFLKLQRQHPRLLLQSFPFGGSLPKQWEEICPNPIHRHLCRLLQYSYRAMLPACPHKHRWYFRITVSCQGACLALSWQHRGAPLICITPKVACQLEKESAFFFRSKGFWLSVLVSTVLQVCQISRAEYQVSIQKKHHFT